MKEQEGIMKEQGGITKEEEGIMKEQEGKMKEQEGIMKEQEEPSLLDRIEGLPEEMQHELLNYLEYTEVLRLRRVCIRFRQLAEVHLSRRAHNGCPLVLISFSSKYYGNLSKFKSVCSSKLVQTKIGFFHKDDDISHSVQSWKKLLQHPDLDWFMENKAPYVKYLYLDSLQLPITNAKQLKFLESFTKLEVLKSKCFFLSSIDVWDCCLSNSDDNVMFPVFLSNTFKSLKQFIVLNVEVISSKNVPEEEPTTKQLNRFWMLVEELMKTTKMEYFFDPCLQHDVIDETHLKMKLETLSRMIQSCNKLDKPMNKFSLENLCDSVNNSERSIDMALFRAFFEICYKFNILFEDVFKDTYFHSSMGDQFAKYVRTMISCYPEDLQNYNYENLKAAEFQISEIRHFRRVGTLKCPNLQGLSLQFLRSGCQDHEYARHIANRLFHDTKLENLTSLVLNFEPEILAEIPLCVTPSDLVSSCANLKYLSLQNIAAASSSFVHLWKGLRCLEHLRLNDCYSLCDDSFIGDNPQEPAICQLRNLKYLEILNLGRMSGITDKTLKDAIRHIKLRCFRLMAAVHTRQHGEYKRLLSPHSERFRSGVYLKNFIFCDNISLDGLRSLKTGVFAETIEEFVVNGLGMYVHDDDDDDENDDDAHDDDDDDDDAHDDDDDDDDAHDDDDDAHDDAHDHDDYEDQLISVLKEFRSWRF